MKTFFFVFALLALVLAVYPFLDSHDGDAPVTGLPWQIEQLPGGSTRVFGLQVGVSTLADAQQQLGDDHELAIIAASDEDGSLEMYFGHYRAGLLSGKLVLLTRVAPEKIRRWRDDAVKSEYMASGKAKKYSLSAEDMPQVLAETIVALTFVPAVNLDEDVVLARFGEPQQRVDAPGVTHYLYPDKGLDLALYTRSKEVLQYVPPNEFQRLVQPLLRSVQPQGSD